MVILANHQPSSRLAEATPFPARAWGTAAFTDLGAYGHWYVDKFDFYTFYMHGSDNVFLGNAVPANQPSLLPTRGGAARHGTADLSRATTIPIPD